MSPLAIYGNSIFIYNVKNEEKEGGNYNYDYLANASRKISMFGLNCQNNTKKSMTGTWITLTRHPQSLSSLNACSSLIEDIGLAICRCQYIPKCEV